MKSPKIEENSARRGRLPCLPFLGLRQELKVEVLARHVMKVSFLSMVIADSTVENLNGYNC